MSCVILFGMQRKHIRRVRTNYRHSVYAGTEKERERQREGEEQADKQARTHRQSTSFHKQFHERGALCAAENLITVETGETARKNFICFEVAAAQLGQGRQEGRRQLTAG